MTGKAVGEDNNREFASARIFRYYKSHLYTFLYHVALYVMMFGIVFYNYNLFVAGLFFAQITGWTSHYILIADLGVVIRDRSRIILPVLVNLAIAMIINSFMAFNKLWPVIFATWGIPLSIFVAYFFRDRGK